MAGHLGSGAAYATATTDFAEGYGDQTERDHATLVQAIKSGRVQAAGD
jgi:hypothetical protein